MSKKNPHIQPDKFRDSLATVQEDGKRNWIYPKKVSGKFYRWRTYVSWVLLGILFAGPFIQVGGRPWFLFNIFERKFIIFGAVFWPQDTHLLIFLLLIFVVFIILFTVVFGRVFCGWACPQTLFMEMVFRKIEYWIEGDANQQRQLNAMEWNGEKIRKKGFKMTLFVLISLLISHTVMAYLIGLDKVVEIVSQPPSQNLSGFIGLMAFTGIFLFVFTWFREQACLVVCPYGRLQGVLLDNNSINVSYDYVRGEPRAPIRKNQATEAPKGDCIDCGLCVQVCPTGIDIRNGIQMECVNCTACMDACDEVMVKVDRPLGLIRYASENSIQQGKQQLVTPRVKGYSVILVILMAMFIGLLVTRDDLGATVMRFSGMTFQERENGQISNLYQITIINKTFEAQQVGLGAEDEKYHIEIIGDQNWTIPGQTKFEGRFFVVISGENVKANQENIHLNLLQNGKIIERKKTSFVAPLSQK
ncbi:cytochrome c oxidase accessory protein CcoG [Pararhodonellum marinum]|uniref:cytochrome c oxidase accessory protein CcoG n=1 Tax=Pararhodonellum marinum TaxID=2755358 RepID=UPI00188FE7D1|nr:cytochrome c oxidase accessory protein CcoG [Pararhodonellum marinum]